MTANTDDYEQNWSLLGWLMKIRHRSSETKMQEHVRRVGHWCGRFGILLLVLTAIYMYNWRAFTPEN